MVTIARAAISERFIDTCICLETVELLHVRILIYDAPEAGFVIRSIFKRACPKSSVYRTEIAAGVLTSQLLPCSIVRTTHIHLYQDLQMRLDRIVAEGVGKKFGRRVIFSGVDAIFEAGEVVAVTGHNGSGKSTLLRILAGLLTPSFGRVSGMSEGAEVVADQVTTSTGFVAPYLNVYDSFSARENLQFIGRARRLNPSTRMDEVLARVGLDPRSDAPVSTYSSGMMQRVRLAAAVLHDPSVLMFDEPSSNLDAAGRRVVRELIAQFRSEGKLIVLATNDEDEAAACDRTICVADFVKSP